jgi:hypothetical protein
LGGGPVEVNAMLDIRVICMYFAVKGR